MSAEEAEKLAATPVQPPAQTPARPAASGFRGTPIDLTKVTVPVLAINGELDRPHYKTTRMARELFNFTNVVLPGKSHLTAIAFPTIPPLYIDSLAGFINSHDSAASPRTTTARK